MADGGKVIIKIDGDNKGFKSAMSGLGKVAQAAAKGIAVGVGAAATAIGAIGVQAVKACGDYEQLVGGVETLFKDSAGVVENYANQAYQTAGKSANQYMNTVTSFSASLLQSLGGDTAKAAEYGNQAVIDMSDNANKMGTSIEMIQNAYQGFAKQNYTMLDNLKLGYGGTKEEMQRLLNDAQKISGVKYDISSFSDITQAIHVIQTEMGITGTTAKEAATTIQGSMGMVKASWENLLTGLADPNADIDVLIDNVINSVTTLLQNLEPVVGAVLNKIPVMIGTLGEQIIETLPGIVNTILPSLLETGGQLITTLSNTLLNNASTLGNTATGILMALVNAIISNLPTVISTALTIILTLAEGLIEALPELIPTAIEMILQIVDTILDNIDKIVDLALQLIIALADGLIEALPKLTEKAPEIVIKLAKAIIKATPKILIAAAELIVKLFEGLNNALNSCLAAWGNAIYNYIIKPIADKTKDILAIGKNLVEGLWNGFKEKKDWLIGKIKEWCGSVLDGIKRFFGIHSPSAVMRDEVGAMITEGIAVGIEQATPTLEEVIQKQKQTIVDNYKAAAEAAIDSIDDLIKAENKFASKLKGFGNVYDVVKVKYQGKEIETFELADLGAQTQKLKDYSQVLMDVKKRGGVPAAFFEYLRDLSVEEGMKFAKTLLNADDATFNQYMQNWQEKQNVAEEVSKILYADEAKEVCEEIVSSFGEINADLETQGKENAESWGNGFIKQIEQIMPNVLSKINDLFSGALPTQEFAFSGAGGNLYTSNYYIQPSKGESTQDQLWAIRQSDFINKQRGY